MFSTRKPNRKALSELEHRFMDFIWANGASSADQVREGLAPERSLKDSTVRTVLKRLEEKGYLQHTVEGRTYIYRGVDAPRNVAVSAVRQIIDRFCGGSVEQLLVGMVDNQVLDGEELKKLADKIAGSRKRREDRK